MFCMVICWSPFQWKMCFVHLGKKVDGKILAHQLDTMGIKMKKNPFPVRSPLYVVCRPQPLPNLGTEKRSILKESKQSCLEHLSWIRRVVSRLSSTCWGKMMHSRLRARGSTQNQPGCAAGEWKALVATHYIVCFVEKSWVSFVHVHT